MMKRSRGLSLIEVIISIVIISASVSGVLMAFAHSVKGTGDALVQKQALSIAEEKLAECRQRAYSELSGNSCGSGLTAVSTTQLVTGQTLSSIGQGFSASIEVENTSIGGLAQAQGKKIIVTVWPANDSKNGSRSITLIGYRTNWL